MFTTTCTSSSVYPPALPTASHGHIAIASTLDQWVHDWKLCSWRQSKLPIWLYDSAWAINQSIMDHIGRFEACFVFFLPESQRPRMILIVHPMKIFITSGSTRSLCPEGPSIQCTWGCVRTLKPANQDRRHACLGHKKSSASIQLYPGYKAKERSHRTL